jgi:uncharacterized repeat protein (TIGR03803 family)
MLKEISFGRIALSIVAVCIAAMTVPIQSARAATLDTIYSFCSKRGCADGLQPSEGLTRDLAGNLYGTYGDGGDKAYELTGKPSGKWKETVLRLKCARCGHLSPIGGFIEDTAGNLYTVVQGGANNTGAVVELAVVAGTNERQTQVLYNFGPLGSGDAYAANGLTYAGAASGVPYDGVSPLYGASIAGGAHNSSGTVFELTQSGGTWSEQVIYSFCATGGSGCTDGAEPNAAPVLDASGNLYGTTSNFGPSGGEGVVYELSNSGGAWNETVLHANCQLHNCADGLPIGGLVQDAAGNLFGTALDGIHQRAGLIFKLVPSGTSSTYSVLYNFCSVPKNCRDGVNPLGPLVMDSSGNLFGTTETGGGHDIDDRHLGGGTVFELTGSTLTTLYAFCDQADCRDGEYPNGGLAMDASGDLFGTTNLGGGFDEGTVFKLTP